MDRFANSTISLAVRLLPQQARRRYGAEFEADLRSLPARKHIPYAVSTLAGSPRLRWEVLHSLTGGGAAQCFCGRHDDRRIHTESTDPKVFALECRRCGRVRDPNQREKRKDQRGIGGMSAGAGF